MESLHGFHTRNKFETITCSSQSDIYMVFQYLLIYNLFYIRHKAKV